MLARLAQVERARHVRCPALVLPACASQTALSLHNETCKLMSALRASLELPFTSRLTASVFSATSQPQPLSFSQNVTHRPGSGRHRNFIRAAHAPLSTSSSCESLTGAAVPGCAR